jgi:hypothetical protein
MEIKIFGFIITLTIKRPARPAQLPPLYIDESARLAAVTALDLGAIKARAQALRAELDS